ncbi:MAG: acyltransferase family protein [Succinivibrio sp.]
MQQRSDLNFLKGIAIIFVVLYHYYVLMQGSRLTSLSLFDGGFLGVDIFLVISGYLLASSCTYRLENNSFSYPKFIIHRFARLYPPLLGLCVFVVISGYFLLYPEVYIETVREVGAAIVGIGNFRLAKTGGYFSLNSSDKLLLHSWYLCITIQAFIVCPLLLVIIKRFVPQKGMKYCIALVTAALFVLALLKFGKHSSGYLLTNCRIWEFSFGMLCYYIEKDLPEKFYEQKKLRALMFFSGVIILLYFLLSVRLENGQWYPTTSLPTVLAVLPVILARSSLTDRLLPVNILGKASYSLYLWHWPVLILMMRMGLSYTVISAVVAVAVVALFSVLSYRILELKKMGRVVFSSLLVIVAVSYVLFAVLKYDSYLANYMVDLNSILDENQASKSADVKDESRTPYVYRNIAGQNVYHYGPKDKRADTFVIGDSHADQFTYFFKFVCKDPVYMFTMHANMVYGRNFKDLTITIPMVLSTPESRHAYYEVYEKMLDDLERGDRVIIANRWDLFISYYLKEHSLKDTAENEKIAMQVIIDDLDEKIKQRDDLNFYLLSQGIFTSEQVVNCIKSDLSNSFLRHILDTNVCKNTRSYLDNNLIKMINTALIEYAKTRDNVTYIDKNVPLYIAEDLYKTYSDDGKPLFYDDNHLSIYGGVLVGSYVMDEIKNKK